MNRRLIRADGTEEEIGRLTIAQIRLLIGANCLDSVNLRHLGEPLQVLVIDDSGFAVEPIEHLDGHIELRATCALKPVNAKATELYHRNCIAGTTHPIVGDVVLCFDSDFE